MSTPPRIAVIGANGQLGQALVKGLSPTYQVWPFTRAQLDVTNPQSVAHALAGEWAAIVNTAAFHKVEACQSNPAQSFAVNAAGAWHVAQVAQQCGAKCVFVSSNYVFDGQQHLPYTESAATGPLNVYGLSKLSGEQCTLLANPNALVLRIAAVFGDGPNFVESTVQKALTQPSLEAVCDQWVSPTYTYDAARLLLGLLQHNASGVVHASNHGACSWYEFACEVLAQCNLKAQVQAVGASRFYSAVKRPAFAAMQSERLGLWGLQARPWQEGLRDYLKQKGYA